MAFITNNGAKKVGERITELVKVSARFDMLVGFFYFSAIRILAEALAANAASRHARL